jgi:hypothetical protein
LYKKSEKEFDSNKFDNKNIDKEIDSSTATLAERLRPLVESGPTGTDRKKFEKIECRSNFGQTEESVEEDEHSSADAVL